MVTPEKDNQVLIKNRNRNRKRNENRNTTSEKVLKVTSAENVNNCSSNKLQRNSMKV